jgi:putative SOS response-associated peptidase YedK
VQLHWGLIPSWADDPKISNRMTNARAETVATKPSFRSAFKKRRCLIVADGFYE